MGRDNLTKEEAETLKARNVGGSRFIDKEDAERFAIAADRYTAFHTRSKEAAFQNLVDLGFIDETGQPTKHYR